MPENNRTDPFKKLSRRERELLEIVHRLKNATVTEIMDAMEHPPTRPAVRALLAVMERKGYLTHSKSGREFVYESAVPQEAAATSLFQGIINNFFGGSLKNALASHLAETGEKYTEEELKELSDIVNRARKDDR